MASDLDGFFTDLGANILPCETWSKCCGFHTLFTHRKMSLGMIGDIIEDAAKSKANIIITPCPLCYLALDLFQYSSRIQGVTTHAIPVIHLPQIIGLALGLNPRKLELHKHFTSLKPLFDGF